MKALLSMLFAGAVSFVAGIVACVVAGIRPWSLPMLALTIGVWIVVFVALIHVPTTRPVAEPKPWEV